jgi:hypothetical protein
MIKDKSRGHVGDHVRWNKKGLFLGPLGAENTDLGEIAAPKKLGHDLTDSAPASHWRWTLSLFPKSRFTENPVLRLKT